MIYFVAMQNRSGSTWLCHMLTSTQAVGVAAEHYHDMLPDLPKGWARFVASGGGGVKLNIQQAEPLLAVAEDVMRRSRWIWLRRRDAWATTISQLRAEATGVWIAPTGVECVAAGPVELGEDQLVLRHDQVKRVDEEWLRWFRRNGIRPLCVWYEDLLEQPRELVYLILGFLGVYYTGDVTLNLTRVQRTTEDVELAVQLSKKYGP